MPRTGRRHRWGTIGPNPAGPGSVTRCTACQLVRVIDAGPEPRRRERYERDGVVVASGSAHNTRPPECPWSQVGSN